MKRIIFLEFGKYLSFTKKMVNGLSLFENNVNELKKLFGDCLIDILVLTHDEGESKKDTLIKLCKNVNIKLISVNYWENLKNFHLIDIEKREEYKNIFKSFVRDEKHCPLGYDNKKNFNPGSLWYRRYIVFRLYDDYITDNKLKYHDLLCITRLFSTKIIYLKNIINFSDDKLYFSPDTLFIGNYNNIQKLVKFGKKTLFNSEKNKDNVLIMKNDELFMNICYDYDTNICSHYFCSEIQILYYIYKNFNKYENIRFNFPKYFDKISEVNKIYHEDDVYINKSLIELEVFKKDNSSLFIRIYK
jgi:hypothetical protein